MAQAKKKTPIVKQWNRPDNDFHFGVEIDYDEEFNCDSDCDPYCRCSRIANARVTEINIGYIVYDFARGIPRKRGNIDLTKLKDKSAYYAIERFVRLQELTGESFDVQHTGGYYGEEISGVDLDLPTFNKICEFIEALKSASVTDCIRQSLINEYGFLLKELEGKDFVCKTVKLADIKRMNNTYTKKLDQGIMKSYHEHDLPLGVLLQTGDSYRLIDGYHRLAAAQNEELKKAEFFVCGV